MRNTKLFLNDRLLNETGSALVVVLIAAALGTLVLSSLVTSMIEAEIAGREVESSEAFYHAEAGLQHALEVIVLSPDGLQDDLDGPDGVEGTADDGFVLGTSPIAFGSGTYLARLVNNWDASCSGDEDSDSDSDNDEFCDDGSDDDDGDSDDDGVPDAVDSDGIAHLWVMGTADGSVAVIRATVDVTAGDALGSGIYTNGTIFSGSGSKVDARNATIHGNGGLTLARNSAIYGDPGTSQKASVRNGTTIDGNQLDSAEAKAYEDAHSGLDPIEIPEVVPDDYAHLADYRFAADGTVYDRNGNVVAHNSWNSWKFSGGEWKLGNVDSAYEPSTNFFETDVSVTAQDRITTSIIATGSVKMNGGRVQADKQDLLIVSGGDVQLNGNADALAYVGNVYLREQFYSNGTSGMKGNIVAMDIADDHKLVSGDAITLSSEIVVDDSLRNTLGSDGAGLTDWYTYLRDDFERIFR